ncbi:MAG TPA: DUF2807 domain-containing protein [Vitreimonas sp.]|uniref:GIN domain-containing protein n=1 Tax=Vitreimonas sp. TaxID=3069702 RepID=UPI002D5015CE|nr:DUF2807 domain-containing protein [Vitreimonas sp.]HYD88311.1 DUF2807 domain-containing protein [Vitreimonas sp.]
MERFVFVTAIVVAVIFGIGAVFGSGNFISFDMDGDGGTAPIVETTAGRLEPQVYSGGELRLKHLAAVVTITPENRSDYLIEISSPGGTPMPTVTAEEGRVTIDGRLRGRISGCTEDGGAQLRGYENVTAAQLPRIVIRAPRALTINRNGAGSTDIAAAEAVDLDLAGCSTATLADVADALDLEVAGSGRVRAGAARRLSADVAGSGDISIGSVSEGADIDLAGSGTVTIASLSGDLSADSAGSGSVVVQGGAVTLASVDLAGSGDVTITAPVQTLNVSIVGSGDVAVAGAVGDIEADIAGSGDVTAQSVTGSVSKHIMGSGDVQVGR